MKKLLFAVSALAALALLAPSTGFAQHVHPNQVGLWEFSDGTGANGTFVVGDPVVVFLVLLKPEKDGIPYDTINAFECQLNFNPAGNLFKLGEVFPPQAINVGDIGNIGMGYLEYIVGLGADYPVTSESVDLLAINFMHTAPGQIEVSLSPTSAPSIDGQMAYQSVEGDLRIMYSAGGEDGNPDDIPVWIFDGNATPIQTESFGSVKALFR